MITLHGHQITVVRRHLTEPGWEYQVTDPSGCVVASGWTVGQGPRAKSVAMHDAIEALTRRIGRAA